MLPAFAVFLGGGLGSVLRWLICSGISLYWGTFLTNILGGFHYRSPLSIHFRKSCLVPGMAIIPHIGDEGRLVLTLNLIPSTYIFLCDKKTTPVKVASKKIGCGSRIPARTLANLRHNFRHKSII
jgi:hypothetical protein